MGPLPAAVYWRRRCVALASALTVVGLVAATAGVRAPVADPVPAAVRAVDGASTRGAPGGVATSREAGAGVAGEGRTPGSTTTEGPPALAPVPGSAPDGTAPPGARAGGTAGGSALPGDTAPDSAAPGPPSGAAVPPGAAEGAADAPHGPFPSSSAPPSSAPPSSAGVEGTSERIRPDDTPRPSVAAQSPVPVPRTGPVPCTNDMLSATAEIDRAVHRVGSRPVLRLVLANVSGQPCVRDLDAARQEIVVWSSDGVDRLWSSNDCVNAPTVDLRTLVPGRPVAFAVTWAERTTVPGCSQPRTVVPAGSYRLLVRLDDLVSPPTPFIRTP